MDVEFFEQINIPLPRERIYARLGYSQGLTSLPKPQKDKIELSLDRARRLLELKGAGVIIPIASLDPAQVTAGGITFASRALARFLASSSQLLLMGATAGSKIMEAIKERSHGDDITSAVIFDAAASESVDAALSWIMRYFRQALRRENKLLSKGRYSAGYDDFALDNQKIICETLNLGRLGVKVTETYMLLPEKSVTAVCGIKQS